MRPNHRFTFERRQRADDFTSDGDDWVKVWECYGHLTPASGRETLAGEQVTPLVQQDAMVPFYPELREDDRCVDKFGAVNQIVSIVVDEDQYRTPWLKIRLTRTGKYVDRAVYDLVGIGEPISKVYYVDAESLQIYFDADGNPFHE